MNDSVGVLVKLYEWTINVCMYLWWNKKILKSRFMLLNAVRELDTEWIVRSAICMNLETKSEHWTESEYLQVLISEANWMWYDFQTEKCLRFEHVISPLSAWFTQNRNTIWTRRFVLVFGTMNLVRMVSNITPHLLGVNHSSPFSFPSHCILESINWFPIQQ